MVVENKDQIRKMLTKVRAVPITAKYDLTIILSSEIDVFKCQSAIIDILWLYRFMYFEFNFMNIDAVMLLPDNEQVEINREKTMSGDNTIKVTVSFEVQTYYPSYRKPNLEDDKDIILYPKKTKWFSNIIEAREKNTQWNMDDRSDQDINSQT